jgi:hypothetical protein
LASVVSPGFAISGLWSVEEHGGERRAVLGVRMEDHDNQAQLMVSPDYELLARDHLVRLAGHRASRSHARNRPPAAGSLSCDGRIVNLGMSQVGAIILRLLPTDRGQYRACRLHYQRSKLLRYRGARETLAKSLEAQIIDLASKH